MLIFVFISICIDSWTLPDIFFVKLRISSFLKICTPWYKQSHSLAQDFEIFLFCFRQNISKCYFFVSAGKKMMIFLISVWFASFYRVLSVNSLHATVAIFSNFWSFFMVFQLVFDNLSKSLIIYSLRLVTLFIEA